MNFWQLLRDRKLSRLLRVRWSGQITDGIFQSALASFILFSPERQASAVNAAVAFAVVLLPYSIVGPFVGTLLDRFSRQRAILFSNLVRSGTLLVVAFLIFNGYTGFEITVVVLIAFGVNRLILAGLSAGIPPMTTPKDLISANALAVTGGSVWVVLGGGIGLEFDNFTTGHQMRTVQMPSSFLLVPLIISWQPSLPRYLLKMRLVRGLTRLLKVALHRV